MSSGETGVARPCYQETSSGGEQQIRGKTFFLLFLLLLKSFEQMWHLNGASCSAINDWRCAHVKVSFIFWFVSF